MFHPTQEIKLMSIVPFYVGFPSSEKWSDLIINYYQFPFYVRKYY